MFPESNEEVEDSSYSCKDIRIKKKSTHQTNKDKFPESDDDVEGSRYSCKDIRIKKESTKQTNISISVFISYIPSFLNNIV